MYITAVVSKPPQPKQAQSLTMGIIYRQQKYPLTLGQLNGARFAGGEDRELVGEKRISSV